MHLLQRHAGRTGFHLVPLPLVRLRDQPVPQVQGAEHRVCMPEMRVTGGHNEWET